MSASPTLPRLTFSPQTSQGDAHRDWMCASLDVLVRLIEQVAPGMRGSVLLLEDDGVTLRHGAAPNLPQAFWQSIDGERLGPSAGSCGTAAYRRERVIVRDIANDPLWVDYRELAGSFGLAACWSTPIIDVDGQLLGTFAMYYDEVRDPAPADIELTQTATLLSANIITRARTARMLHEREQELLKNHAGLRAALDASATSTWRWDMRTNAVDCDEGLFRLFGLDPAVGAGTFDLFVSRIHPDDRDRVIAAAQRCSTDGVDLDEEFRIVCPDGSIRWAVDKGKTVLDEHGTPCYLIGACLDITERRATDDGFRALAESLPQLAWMADAAGDIYWYNQRWYDYTGTRLEDVRGWGWTAVHHPDHVDRVVRRIQQSWDSGDPWEDTFPLRGRDGEYRWFLSRARPIRDADGRVVRWFGTNTDITELREAEVARDRALADAEAERQKAQWANQTKTDFLAAMSHDLRTPLNAIGGYADLAAEGVYGEVNEAQRQAMQRIRSASNHLLSLIDDILGFAKLEAGRVELRIEQLSVNDSVAAAVSMLEPQAAKKGLSLAARLGPEDLRVRADAERLMQILTNLLTNAVKFTANGSITVSVRGDRHGAEVAVSDTGRGIPADQLGVVFEPFVQATRTTTERHEGVGLGLAISRELARAMGGDLTVESELSRGSTFRLRLPVT